MNFFVKTKQSLKKLNILKTNLEYFLSDRLHKASLDPISKDYNVTPRSKKYNKSLRGIFFVVSMFAR